MEAAADPSRITRDLVVIGASAGGVETLRQVVAGLDPDLPAAVLVVLHLAPGSPSALPSILGRAGRIRCRAADDGEALRPGELLVAPPDRHLVVEDGAVRLTVGPRENGHRPSIDVLFRSAAQERGERVVGVVLSGTRDDGTAGLAQIKAQGGAAVVQDPRDAMYPSMPASAIERVSVDAVVPAAEIADTVRAIVNGDAPPAPGEQPEQQRPAGAERATTICPECGGVLEEREEAGVPQWECRVGHRYSPRSLADAQAQDVEAALWTAVRALRDRSLVLERLAEQCEASGQPFAARSFRRKAADAGAQAEAVLQALSAAAAGTLTSIGITGPEEETSADATG
jgi:two-component system chemotaxis response regulator CheB